MTSMTMKTYSLKGVSALFEYEAGFLFRKSSQKKIENRPNSDGYMHTEVGGKSWKVHRIIFFLCRGYEPEVVDHINGDTLDNRIENLRGCTQKQNMFNQKCKAGESGIQGVSKFGDKWRVRLGIGSRRISLGLYDCLELAGFIAEEARDKYHGEYSVNRRSYESN